MAHATNSATVNATRRASRKPHREFTETGNKDKKSLHINSLRSSLVDKETLTNVNNKAFFIYVIDDIQKVTKSYMEQ